MAQERDLLEMIHKRNIRRKGAKNLNSAIVAESGTGKSWAGIRICEVFYDRYLDVPFTADNIVFTISEFLKLVKVLPECSFIIFDDAGLKFSSVKWFEELNQILGWTLQSYRWKIINVIFTIPVLKWLDRIGRGMLHARLDMIKPGYGVFKRYAYSQDYDKAYATRILSLYLDEPNKKLVEEYEAKKRKFLKREYDMYLRTAEKRESQLLTIDQIVDIVLEAPDIYKYKRKFNARLIQTNLNIGKDKAYLALANIVKLKEGGNLNKRKKAL
jgi:hypothetical protein